MRPLGGSDLDRQLDSFRALCRERGFALTHQRLVIYREMLLMGGHPGPELIYDRVRQHIPSISLGTVYKNVKTFLDAGLLREVSLHHGSQRLEPNLEPHHHLVCLRCRGIFDLPAEDLAPLRVKRSVLSGFRIQRYSVEVLGWCADCDPGVSHEELSARGRTSAKHT